MKQVCKLNSISAWFYKSIGGMSCIHFNRGASEYEAESPWWWHWNIPSPGHHQQWHWSCRIKDPCINILRPRQNGQHLADNILKCIFFNENVWILLKISPNFVPNFQINKYFRIGSDHGWHQPGDTPLSEPMMVKLRTHMRHSASIN